MQVATQAAEMRSQQGGEQEAKEQVRQESSSASGAQGQLAPYEVALRQKIWEALSNEELLGMLNQATLEDNGRPGGGGGEDGGHGEKAPATPPWSAVPSPCSPSAPCEAAKGKEA